MRNSNDTTASTLFDHHAYISDSNRNAVTAASLRIIGWLTMVSPKDVGVHLPLLLPVIVHAMNDRTSWERQEVAVSINIKKQGLLKHCSYRHSDFYSLILLLLPCMEFIAFPTSPNMCILKNQTLKFSRFVSSILDCNYRKNGFFKFESLLCHYTSRNYCYSEWKHCSFNFYYSSLL
jgi:hypothetical protein